MVPNNPKDEEVARTLEKLKLEPITAEGGQDAVLGPIYNLLVHAPPGDDCVFHWFCKKARPVVTEAATFLLRLHAYSNSVMVEDWKRKMAGVLHGCCNCIQSYQEIKLTCRDTYFGAFSKVVLDTFFVAVDDWELDSILNAVEESGISMDSKKSLNDLAPAILYHILSSISFFRDQEIVRLFYEQPPRYVVPSWPNNTLPGLLLLLFQGNEEVRIWAERQLDNCRPLPKECFSADYRHILQAVISCLVPGAPDNSKFAYSLALLPISVFALWPGLSKLIRLMPKEIVNEHDEMRILCRSIISHLHDGGSHFYEVIRVFAHLLKAYGKLLWRGESNEYPQVIFDSIKDNPSYINLVLDLNVDDVRLSAALDWFQPYLVSIRRMPIFEEGLKRLVSFSCEELQHERFGEKRSIIMTVLLQTLDVVFTQDGDKATQSIIIHVIAIHAESIVNVALARMAESWKCARTLARKLLRICLDTSCIDDAICQVALALREVETESLPQTLQIVQPSFHESIWNQIYNSVMKADASAIEFLISIVSPTAHLDILNPDAYTNPNLSPNIQKRISEVVMSINTALSTMRAKFLGVITQFTFTSASSTSANIVQLLLRRGNTAERVTILFVSPVEELQAAAQIILCEAYDSDIRSDCFREILKDLPSASIEGLLTTLRIFEQYGRILPEAGSFAKSLVRSMTDVIDILTNGRDGLFFNPSVMNISEKDFSKRILHLWEAMCNAITTIFRRTPLWSKVIDPEAMIDWMRDALIFARDLLAQRRSFEAAVNSPVDQEDKTALSPRNSSPIGKQMLNHMQAILTESIRWLRLTDVELLHQSSSLVLSLMDCFREIGLVPSVDALAKLEKFLDSARKATIPVNLRTKLSERHLAELTAVLSSFTAQRVSHVETVGKLKSSEPPSISQDDTHSRYNASDGGQRMSDRLSKKQSEKAASSSSASLITTDSSFSVRPTVSNHNFSMKANKKATSRNSSLMSQVRSQATARAFAKSSLHEKHRRRVTSPVNTDRNFGLSAAHDTREISRSKKDSDSTSSSSSEESEDQGGLATLGRLQKSPVKIKKPIPRRTIKLLEPHFSGQSAILERIRKRDEAQRASLRLKPDFRPLYRTILSWNYDHDGPEPPFSGEKSEYSMIPDSFNSKDEYHRIFEPLLVLECWNQLIKSKEDTPPEVLIGRINSRQYIDEWIDFDVTIVDRIPDKWRISEMDIVLLRSSTGQCSTLAKVQSSRRTGMEVEVTLRCLPTLTGKDPGLHINSRWRISKVFSLTTISREYGALMAFPYYDLFMDILKSKISLAPEMSPIEIQRAMKVHHVNEPQATAILGSLRTEGFSLIQGPPGTGKTWTICGIIGAFMSSRVRPATVINAGRANTLPEKTPHAKVLVCAPSNAAIDEVAKRLRNGVRNADGQLVVPNVVRIGTEDAINISVQDLSLDRLVDQRLNADPRQQTLAFNATDTLASLRTQMKDLKITKALKLEEMTNTHGNVTRAQVLESELNILNAKRSSLSQEFTRLKDQQTANFRTLDAARRKYRADILSEADVICSTLSGAGHEVLENTDFDIIVIDEAAQSVELSSLIPLKFRAKRCIMVGDPQQLPPTVLSPLASKYGYGRSLFLRLQKSKPEAIHLLSIQYRMHPDISRLPSCLFYEGRIADGPDMATKTSQPWHSNPLFGTYKFLNVAGHERTTLNGHSLMNHEECDVAVALYTRLKTEYAKVDFDFRIGIISMYRAQLLELKNKFRTAFGAEILGKIDFNTVDGFQGQEKDIIIVSCVRAGPGVQSIGFLSDSRRLNVAITRARSSLFVLGHASTLARSDALWKRIVEGAQNTSYLLEANVNIFRKSLASSFARTPVKVASERHAIDIIPPNLLPVKRDSIGITESTASSPNTSVIPKHFSGLGSEEEGPTINKKRRTSWISTPTTSTSSTGLNMTSKSESSTRSLSHKPQIRKKDAKASLFIPKKKEISKVGTIELSMLC